MKGNIPIDFCDYCFLSHEKIHKNHTAFQYVNKVTNAHCIGCGSCMCKECIETSKNYLEGSCLLKYHFYLCAGCVIEKRSNLEYRNFVTSLIMKHEETMQEEMQSSILLYSQKPQLGDSLMPSNNTSTSTSLQRDSTLKQLSQHIHKNGLSSSNLSRT